ncbi:hypothetical protein DL769_000440 [Monosporascus sp. CRB-8-3]|nr:hypothetical protein DL769_000440 [Monosporascus sp. CRB-8-3]
MRSAGPGPPDAHSPRGAGPPRGLLLVLLSRSNQPRRRPREGRAPAPAGPRCAYHHEVSFGEQETGGPDPEPRVSPSSPLVSFGDDGNDGAGTR